MITTIGPSILLFYIVAKKTEMNLFLVHLLLCVNRIIDSLYIYIYPTLARKIVHLSETTEITITLLTF